MTDYTVRRVTGADQPQIVHHRQAMFTEMGAHTTEQIAAMTSVYPSWLRKHLTTDDYVGWFAVAEDGLVVGGVGLHIQHLIPGPDNPDHRPIPHIVDVYVHYEHRRKGIAQVLMQHTIDWCKSQGYPKVTLNTSEAGRPLYERLGFVIDNHMTLQLFYPSDTSKSGTTNGGGPRF